MANQEWEKEQSRIDKVVEVIEDKVDKMSLHKKGVQEGIVDLRRNFWEDVTVNVDEPDDIIETQASIKQQAELLSERERNHGQMSRQLKLLDRLSNSPYFGRIDFLEEGSASSEPIYIGIMSLMDQKGDEFLIYDWRAPISSMYYDFTPGPASYGSLDGTVKGEITLKRQFIIRGAKIEGMFDTGLTIGDALLRKVLGHMASTQMKSIVATIQKEQNQIIRNVKDRYLIVQGAAGSGKTSAALQRVAFLLYHYRKTLRSDNILLFSPNPLFNSFISTVLPELGEENMAQTTFKDYIDAKIGKDLKLENPFEQTEAFLTFPDSDENRVRLAGIRFKASPDYKHLLDIYAEGLGRGGLIFKDILFRDQPIARGREIGDYFYGLPDSLSIADRMEQVRDWLLRKTARFAKTEREKDWVLEEGELLDKEDYADIYEKLQEKKKFTDETFDDYDREELLLRKIVINRRIKPIRRKIKLLEFINATAVYCEVFYVPHEGIRLPEQWAAVCKQSRARLEEGECPWEDATPYLYLKEKLRGKKSNRDIRHLFIDEAQDYSPFQLAYLKEAFPGSKMTILGDLNQAIYAQSFGAETMLSEGLYKQEEVKKLTLLRSYRSTRQIMDFARHIIPSGEKIEPFQRDGGKPEWIQLGTDQREPVIVKQVEALKASGHETIALICKTMEESLKAYRALKDKLPVKLIDQATYQFDKGFIIIPVYLAKGIEFDAAIINDASSGNYDREHERFLFYTACTRAMHRLTMLCSGEPTPFLAGVPEETYEKKRCAGESRDDRD